MSAIPDKEAERRLAWRCRRGMLELDIVLQRFVEQYAHTLSIAELTALDTMLDLPDNDFWNLISDATTTHEDSGLASVLGKMRAI